MRYYPDKKDKYDKKELEDLKAQPWMVNALKMNPSYLSWGPYEDYMCKYNDKEAEEKNAEAIKMGWKPMHKSSGWEARCIIDSWKEFTQQFGLDNLNEVVNFYFEIERDNVKCEACGQTGVNPKTKIISDNFYSHSSYPNDLTEQAWNDKITDDEVEALIKAGRLTDFIEGRWHFDKEKNIWQKLDENREWQDSEEAPVMPTAKEVNSKQGRGFMGHDAINRWTLIEQRAKRLGVYGHCSECEGRGYVFTEPKAKLGLVLWAILPRKGCSRGIHIKDIKKKEVKEAVDFLIEAKNRNNDRFSQLEKYNI